MNKNLIHSFTRPRAFEGNRKSI